jgi:hypothetical protein
MRQHHKRLLLNNIYFSSGMQENVWSKPADAEAVSHAYKAMYIHTQEVVNLPHTGKRIMQNSHRFCSLHTISGCLTHYDECLLLPNISTSVPTNCEMLRVMHRII